MNSYAQVRRYTNQLLDYAEQGIIDWETLAREALEWMSEAEVERFARRNDYFIETDEDLAE